MVRRIHISRSAMVWTSGVIMLIAFILVCPTSSAPAQPTPLKTKTVESPPHIQSIIQPAQPIPVGPTNPTIAPTPADASNSNPSSSQVVVNKTHPLNPVSYTPDDLRSVGNGQSMRAEAATALTRMFNDAAAVGHSLVADSAYRSYNTQITTYNSIVNAYGQTYADTVSARPGYSEHQTGWAVDIGSGGCHIDNCFDTIPAGQWTQANAAKYGFIMRYPSGLTETTGYAHEAWHFRYVGPALAQAMQAKGILTLEQYFGISGGTIYK